MHFFEPWDPENLPAGHTVHLAGLASVSMNFPAGHSRTPVEPLASATPVTASKQNVCFDVFWKNPVGHKWHRSSAGVEVYFPMAQSAHRDKPSASANSPGLHCVQLVSPEDAWIHPVGHGMQFVPDVLEIVPGLQRICTVPPPPTRYPGPTFWQDVALGYS